MNDRTRILLIAAVVVVVVGAIAGIGIYTERVAPFRTVVVRVDDDVEVRLGYFVKRAATSGVPSLQLLNTIAREEVMLKAAGQPPYDIEIGDEDLDAYIRSVPQGDGERLTDAEFDEWWRQQLNESGFSAEELRDIMQRNLTANLMRDYLGERVETVAEQVLLQLILSPDAQSAQAAVVRLDAGESFTALAQELNPAELNTPRSEWGWFPREGLPSGFDRMAFDQLAVGEHSPVMPLPPEAGQAPTYAIIRVADRVAAREIDAAALAGMRARALDTWLAEEMGRREVSFHGFNNGYDSETDAWVSWQIQRNKRQRR